MASRRPSRDAQGIPMIWRAFATPEKLPTMCMYSPSTGARPIFVTLALCGGRSRGEGGLNPPDTETRWRYVSIPNIPPHRSRFYRRGEPGTFSVVHGLLLATNSPRVG